MSEHTIDLQAGRYGGNDKEATKGFQEIRGNWGRLKKWLHNGGTPPLIAKITSAYSSGYSWVEMYEAAAGTFTALAGGRASGSGDYPKAFEQNGGQLDLTNLIVELCPSSDFVSKVITLSFDGIGAHVVASNIDSVPSLSFDAGTRVLTVGKNLFLHDIKGKTRGATSGSRTVTIPGGGSGTITDLQNEGSTVVTDAEFINIPANSVELFSFSVNGAGGDLSMANATPRMGAFIGDDGVWRPSWVRGHP